MEKIKVIIDRTEASSEEIRSGMDFGKLSANYTHTVKMKLLMKNLLIGGIGAAVIAGVVVLMTVGDGGSRSASNSNGMSVISETGNRNRAKVAVSEQKDEFASAAPDTTVASTTLLPIAYRQLPTGPGTKGKRYNSLYDYYKEMELTPQEFSIFADRDTVLTGDKGTVLMIKGGSFVDLQDKPVQGELTIRLKECYSLDDMLKENLSTTSGKEILESGGMIWLGAQSGEKELKLKKFSEIEMINPRQQVMEDTAMFLYQGKRNEKGELDWSLDRYSRMPYPVAVFTAGKFHDTLSIDYFARNFRFGKELMVKMLQGRDTTFECTVSFSDHKKVSGFGAGPAWINSEALKELVGLLDNNYTPFVQASAWQTQFVFKVMGEEDFKRYFDGYKAYKREVNLKKGNYMFGDIRGDVSYARPNARFYIGQLGWSNCDKPRLMSKPFDVVVMNTVQLKCHSKEQENTRLIINKKGRGPSIISGIKHPDAELWMFPNIPVDAEVTLIGTLAKDGQLYKAEQTFKVKDKERVRELEYTPSF